MATSSTKETKNTSPETDSSVLSELKETIQKQAAEIATLKKALAASSTTPVPSSQQHHHGPPSSDDLISAYITTPFYTLAFHRVGWLSLFLCSLSLTAVIMNKFEHTLSSQIELAYFVPLLAGHGGNTGGQTVGTVLSALSRGAITVRDAWRVVGKEALSGVCVGSVLACAVAPAAFYLGGISPHVVTVVALTLPLLSTIAATLASVIPFVCVSLGLDPAVISAPAMTTFVDVCGLMSYFCIANRVFLFYGLKL
eukprot:CAMPEP_0172498788 /NCGR_PEP_ID=MMETSP1066-20121228/117428_1 /TAXON_ID=671091 /ORGANISM="Coscinodiscus wailesii, Strain CCMP2513" /LENGTH=253 /DNA_ID=CAMNT_0013272215 /DNA_START=289 /DNA_END=1050 /DNA_ORIENTATION=-